VANRQSQLAAVLAAVAGLVIAVQAIPYQLDDAFIAYRYAESFVAGHGLTFNPGSAPVEGFTSPLWVLLLSVVAGLGGAGQLPIAGTAMGLLSYLGLLAAAFLALRDGKSPNWSGALAVGLLATLPGVTFYATTGMESLLFTWLVVLFCATVLEAIPLKWTLLPLALIAWTRPEAGWLPVVMVAALVGSSGWSRLRVRSTWTPLAVVMAGGVFLVALRWLYFGLPLPHTFYAKGSDSSFGWSYVVGVLTSAQGLALLLLGSCGALLGQRRHRGYWLAAVAWIPAVVLEGGDWMPAGRFMLPALALFALAAGGLAVGRWRRLLPLLVLVAMAWQAHASWKLTGDAHRTMSGLRREATFVTDWLVAAEAVSVATVDIGMIGYRSGAEIVDLGGLTDPRIGSLEGGHLDKAIDMNYLIVERAPDVVVLRVSEPPIAAEDGSPSYVAISRIEQRILDDSSFRAAHTLAFAVFPHNLQRRPFYGRLVYRRNGFRPNPRAEISGKVIQLQSP